MPNGDRRTAYCHKTANSKADAKVLLAQLLDSRESPLSPRMPLGSYLQRWLDDVSSSVRPSTLAHYGLVVRHLEAGLGRLAVGDLAATDVARYLREAGQGRAPRTVRHHRAVLRASLNWGMGLGVVSRNAAKAAKPPMLAATTMTVLTAEETTRLLEATREHRYGPLWTVAALTGMRSGELLGLAWSAVDLDAGHLFVRQQLQRVASEFVLVEPKSQESRRVVPLAPLAVTALRRHRVRQAEERLASGVGGVYDGLVFVTKDGRPYHRGQVLRAFHDALRRAGLPKVRIHDLRHGVASILLAQGVSPRLVMELLGHSTITLTMNTYSHVSATLVREAADSLQLAIGGRS
jgi:integrase